MPKSVELARRAARLERPDDGLRAISALRAHLDSLEERHVENALRAGWSWSQIARQLGVTRQAVHKRYAARLRDRLAREAGTGGDEMVVTPQVRHAVRLAREEAAAMAHRSVGPEHVLLALLRDDQGAAVRALEASGASFSSARREVRRLYGELDDAEVTPPGGVRGLAPVSPRARTALEQSLREAAARGERRLSVEHVLLGLLRDPQGGAVRTLAALGLTATDVESSLADVLAETASEPESDA